MILDTAELPEPRVLAATICVVGAGPVGIAIALELARAGRDVLLLEAGGLAHDDEAQADCAGEVADPRLHGPLETCRERGLGGTSALWAGRSAPFDPIDFERRAWIAESGWPIAYEDVRRHYARAARWCELGEAAFDAATAFERPLPAMIEGFAGGAAWSADTLERFSCPTRFGRRYYAQLAATPGLRVLTHAIVTGIRLDAAGGAVTSLAVRTRANDPVTVTAGHVVLAGGGLETARLLLASRARHERGIGNAHDVVGRYYMSHIAGTIGLFRPTGAVFNGYDVADDGVYCRRRLALRPEAQRRHRIANVIARLHHPNIADPAHGSGVLSALRLGRAAIPHQFRHRLGVAGDDGAATLARHAANVTRDAPEVARFAARMLVGRRLAARKYPSVVVRVPGGRYALDVHAEQEPNRESRVTLADATDRFGMPRLRVDWRYTPGDIASVTTALALLRDDLAAQGCGTLDHDPAAVEHEMTRYGSYTGHHLGLARMGDDPRTSVVDGDCRVHGVRNLHVAGTAVFPTSSQANPTLTAVAIGVRLADRLAALTERLSAEVA